MAIDTSRAARSAIGQQRGHRQPNDWAEFGLVYWGRMRRTCQDWGLPNGLDDPLARALLKALQARAAGTVGEEVARDRPTHWMLRALQARAAGTAGEKVEREGFAGKPVLLFSDHIRDLIARTGLSLLAWLTTWPTT